MSVTSGGRVSGRRHQEINGWRRADGWRTHEDLVEAEALNLVIPRVGSKETIERLADIAERSQILAVDEDEAGTNLVGLGDEHELSNPLPARVVVASGQNALLPDAHGAGFESRVFVLAYLGVETIIVLWRGERPRSVGGCETRQDLRNAV